MAQNNGDLTEKGCGAMMKCLFLKGNAAKNIYNDMSVTSVVSALSTPQSRTGLLG
jgi:hypothetical protein